MEFFLARDKMKKRNSLIELYRFLFSMIIVKYHGFFPYQGAYFGPGRICVEFFFVLSGWFMLKTIDKYCEMSYWKGLFHLLKDKIVGLGVPLFIGLLFNIPYKIIVGMVDWWDFSIWGYLWYVHVMLIVFIFYYTIRRFIKSDKILILIAVIVCVFASIIHAIPSFYSDGYLRAFSAISLGLIISFLPRIQIKNKNLLWIPLVCVQLLVLRMLMFEFAFWEEELLNLVLYPALVYLTFHLPVHNKVFNYLGALSFGLYAYQSIPRLIVTLGYDNVWVSFLIIVFLAVLTDLIKRIIKRKKQNNIQAYTAVN